MKKIRKSVKWIALLSVVMVMGSGCKSNAVQETPTAEVVASAGETESIEETSAEDQRYTEGLVHLEESDVYYYDLDGNGIDEAIHYQIINYDDYEQLELYINDSLWTTATEYSGWIFELYLTDIDVQDNYQEICVHIKDISLMTLSLLRFDEHEITEITDFKSKEVLGGHGDISRIFDIKIPGDNTIELLTDTPISTFIFGNYLVPITFQLDNGQFIELEQEQYPISIVMDLEDWPKHIVKTEFTAMTEPGGSEAAFTAIPGDTVVFDGFSIYEGVFYGKITDAEGKIGWLVTKDDVSSSDDEAYFERVAEWG